MHAEQARRREALRCGFGLAAVALVSGFYATRALAAADDPISGIDNRDAIEKAVAPGLGEQAATSDHIYFLVGDQYTYDDNVFRLPAGADAAALVAPGASREDHINAETAELDAQRTYGRQVFTLDALAADNRYARNTELNYVSTRDKLEWAWELSDLLLGQLGTTFSRTLASFGNTTNYSRNVFDATTTYGTGRYQIGPHWAVFGGVFNTNTTLENASSKGNDNDGKTVDMGTEYAFDPNDSIGFEYRYADTNFSHSLDPNFSDYREDTGRVLFKYAFSERTQLDASAGYEKRSYTVPENRDFAGDIWRVTVQWLPTEKTKLLVDAWRRLAAYESAELAYFVNTGASIAPTWSPTEKLDLSVDGSYHSEKYIGSGVSTLVVFQSRHDTVNTEHANVAYSPVRFFTLTLTCGLERRSSDFTQFNYHDRLLRANGTFKF
jgi:hypothetical protein